MDFFKIIFDKETKELQQNNCDSTLKSNLLKVEVLKETKTKYYIRQYYMYGKECTKSYDKHSFNLI